MFLWCRTKFSCNLQLLLLDLDVFKNRFGQSLTALESLYMRLDQKCIFNFRRNNNFVI
jgi:hypothetical protein